MAVNGGPADTRVRLMLLATIVLWGANMPLVKWLTGAFDSLLLAGLRMVAAACVLLALLRRRGLPWPRLERSQWLQLLACSLLMIYANQGLFVSGIARSTATNAALITALNPLAATCLALWFLGERLSGRRLVGLLFGLAGVALVILKRPGADLAHGGVGDVLIVLAVLVFAAGAVLVQRLAPRLDALTISVVIHAVGAAALLAQCGLQAAITGQLSRVSPGWLPWLGLALSGALSTGVGNLLWSRAITLVGMARASVWLYWLPPFGVAPAVLFLGEPVTIWHAIGLALVLLGTRLSGRKTPPDKRGGDPA
jgi:drug/metabolite transporter (DMT)-like permease